MILVFGGTSDSLKLAEKLDETGYPYMLSVATRYGKELADPKVSQVIEGRLDQEAMKNLIKEKGIDLIIDATHPYAVEVSKNAIQVAQDLEITYIRYERPSLLQQITVETKLSHKSKVYIVKNNQEACKVANRVGKNIFLGTGSKTLGEFVNGLKEKKIIARVLPTSDVILQCEALGLSPENIVGMKGPFSEEINRVLYRNYDIDCMITKESGAEGGFLEKVNTCIEEGITVIIIERERMDYPRVVYSITDLIEQIRNIKN